MSASNDLEESVVDDSRHGPVCEREDGVVFNDLTPQHKVLIPEFHRVLDEVITSSQYVGGRHLEAFESEFAAYAGVRHCIGVGNGSDALEFALRTVDVKGGEVIVPANSFVATATSVIRAGGVPVFADVDDLTGLLSSASVEDRLSRRTRAVVLVHLYGQLAPVETFVEASDRFPVAVVEDAAQAHGARRHGRHAGSFGATAAMSFYPSKNLGALGDGGAVLTMSDEIALKIRRLRDYGAEHKNVHQVVGFNSRLDNLQAAFLSAKLRHLDRWNAARRQAADYYTGQLSDVDGIRLPVVLEGNDHAWHLYVIRVEDRSSFMEKMVAHGIEVGCHYPFPIHLQPGFAYLGYTRGLVPVAERWADQVVSLPLFPGITEGQQDRVVRAVVASR